MLREARFEAMEEAMDEAMFGVMCIDAGRADGGGESHCGDAPRGPEMAPGSIAAVASGQGTSQMLPSASMVGTAPEAPLRAGEPSALPALPCRSAFDLRSGLKGNDSYSGPTMIATASARFVKVVAPSGAI